MKHEKIRSKSLLSGHSVKTGVVLLACLVSAGGSRAEIPVNQWANPVLATADAVLGPLSDAAKLVSAIYTDYCKLNAYTTIQYYKSTETSKRGTSPVQSYQTIIIESGISPKNGTTSIDRRTEIYVDSNGKVTTKEDRSEILISKIGSVHTKCEKLNPDGSLLSSYEYEVEPTLINVHVDVAKYSIYRMKNPNRVYVEMTGAADLLTNCNVNNRETNWLQIAIVSPGTLCVVPFRENNMLTKTPYPHIEVGYSYTPPAK